MRQTGAGYKEDPLEVRVHELVPVCVCGVFQGDRGRIYASAIEYEVDLAELFYRLSDEGIDF